MWLGSIYLVDSGSVLIVRVPALAMEFGMCYYLSRDHLMSVTGKGHEIQVNNGEIGQINKRIIYDMFHSISNVWVVRKS